MHSFVGPDGVSHLTLLPEREEILGWAGAALAQAQGLELAISTYLLIIDPHLDVNTPDDVVSARFLELRRDPLGALLKKLYEVDNLTDAARADLRRVKEARDLLAHHIFSRTDLVAKVATTQGRDEFIAILKSWALTFKQVTDGFLALAMREAERRWSIDGRAAFERGRALAAREAQPGPAVKGLEDALTTEKLEEIGKRLGVQDTPGGSGSDPTRQSFGVGRDPQTRPGRAR
jgi:hypothetical protein